MYFPIPQMLITILRQRVEAPKQFVRRSGAAQRLTSLCNQPPSSAPTDALIRPPTSPIAQNTTAEARMRALRVGLVVSQIARWRVSCQSDPVRTKLTHVARQLVDKTNGKTMPSNTQTLIEGLPRHGDGHGLLPWSDHELNELIKILGSISHPINMSMDESALGARALAGIVMAHLWMESIPQPIEGPTDKPGDAVPAPATPGTLKTSSTATALQICIEKLAACDSVVRIKACLDSALEPFEKPQRLPDGKIAYVDRLRSALAIVEVEKDHVSVVGSELMHPPIRKPCNDVHQLNMFPSLAA